ncbi:endolytic transglycosylase MltG [Virgibacillus sp. NKC19-16]|uniref:endolytic transglycosylase MltG n=1 Tax=Virgibacillus salidurans TaxID=2831673 RepID=UPI001F4676F6|nr:endolytic transglycosylase MltG [Virgibacillus sp. NKC19-16]UJL44920.1 endolytic transglycosylase MltG [Virgibacillus sp. NKC19-16]
MSKKKKIGSYKDNLILRFDEATTVRKVVAIIIIALILILIAGGISGYLYINSALAPVEPESEEEVEVAIPIGSSSSAIAEILEENGLIKDSRIFRFYVQFNNESNFQAGEYTFSPSMTMDEIIDSLKNGRIMEEPIHTITIPEGLNIDEIAEIYAENLHFSKEDFLDQVNDPEYIDELIEAYPTILTSDIMDPSIRTPLEGYLYAATYNFYTDEPSVTSIVEKMLAQTESVVEPYMDEIAEQDLSVHEAITFASIIEKETGMEDQRNKISGVFYNRLEEGMPLQTDPTVLYALGEHKDTVLHEDLEVDSPYNTYQVEALPIGPISNFAESALEAVVNPEESDYLYFLHDGEGSIYYAETYEEHLEYSEEHIE